MKAFKASGNMTNVALQNITVRVVVAVLEAIVWSLYIVSQCSDTGKSLM